MVYQSLYRRYRPRRFSEVRGQQHVVTALHNAVRDGRVGHAYLFSGPRGTGKTTCARILAKAINCEQPVDGEPCLVCQSCVAIQAGTSFDLHELDAASNRRIDEMRQLLESIALGTPGRRKVYILDEVHQLTADASAALLKTLEEPPDHVVFVLATTDPQKVLPTIRSRTQHFEFHLLPAADLEEHVRWLAKDAGLDVDEDAIAHVLRAGGGSARDTLSALDQVVAAGGIDARSSSVDELVAALLERDPGAVLAAVHHAVASGREPRILGEALVVRLRDAFLASVGVALDHLPDVDRVQVAELVDGVDRPFLTRALDVLGTALVEMRQAADPRITLETALVRLADVESDTSVAALLERLERIERALAAGSTGDAPAAAARSSTAAPAPPPAGGGPAEEARRKLAERAGRAAPAPAAPPKAKPTSPPASPPTPELKAEAPLEAKPDPKPEPKLDASTDPAPGAQLDAGAIATAWTEQVLPSVTRIVRSRFAGAAFVGVEGGAAVFALPNDMHRQRCEDMRADVEAVFAERLGRPVALRLVVDTAAAAKPAAEPAASEEEERIDLDDLVDAPAEAAQTGGEKLMGAFPGAELVEEDR